VSYDPRFSDAASEALSLPCFYLTTHRPYWLWGGQADFPLMVSYRTLRRVRRPGRAVVPGWSLDSGGFMELSRHGRWTISPREYIAAAAGYDRDVGRLEWCAPQDWMCEPAIIHGGRVSPGVTAPGTGLSVAEHQRRTVASFLELTALWPQHSDHPECPVMPVLQGWAPADYERCALLYAQAGVNLARFPVVGIGSVCRRSSTRAIADVAGVIRAMDLSAHWFGVKLTGIRVARLAQEERLQPDGTWLPAGAASLDSAAWLYDARRSARLPGCRHVSPVTGAPSPCNNCPAYAAAWRERVLAALRHAHFTSNRDPHPEPGM
jgi:hypothetical protein